MRRNHLIWKLTSQFRLERTPGKLPSPTLHYIKIISSLSASTSSSGHHLSFFAFLLILILLQHYSSVILILIPNIKSFHTLSHSLTAHFLTLLPCCKYNFMRFRCVVSFAVDAMTTTVAESVFFREACV